MQVKSENKKASMFFTSSRPLKFELSRCFRLSLTILHSLTVHLAERLF